MITRLSRLELVCGNPDGLAAFYQAAFGFVRSGQPAAGTPATERSITLRLGKQEVRLIEIEPRGRSYPADVAGWSPLFQHIAIVVADMTSAYARLRTLPGWTPISTSGPQILPPASGGVGAFKFRDPEGHPLELIGFAAGAVPPPWRSTSRDGCLGIDHSAISVTDTSNSVAFYQSLGLHRSGGSLNVGAEQDRLDDIRNAVVEVTALSPAQPTPHVELLCYRGDYDRRVRAQAPNDATATRLVFSVDDRATLDRLCSRHADALLSGPAAHDGDAGRAMLRDPDGHLICLETGT